MAKICTVFTVCGCVCVWRLSLFASACNDNDDDDALLLCALWGFHFYLPPPPPSNWIFSQEAQKWLLNRLISLSYIVKYTLFFRSLLITILHSKDTQISNIYAPCFDAFSILAWRELFFSSWNHITRIISYFVEFNLMKLNPIDDVSMYTPASEMY